MEEKEFDPFNKGTEAEKKAEIEKEKKRRKALRNEITHKLRFEILERDNYRCRYCGASPKDDESIKLEIDHIVPLDRGGTNDRDNLVTSCWQCNEGKKNKLLKRKKLKREYEISDEKKEEILAVVKRSDFNEYKKFWQAEENEEIRQLLYDLNEIIPNQDCIQNCTDCINNGLWYYKGCMQKLNRFITTGDALHSVNNEFIEKVGTDLAVIQQNNKVNVFQHSANTLRCDACYISKRCPVYETGSSCKFDFSANMDFSDPDMALRAVVNIQKERVIRGAFFEKVDGGALDKNLSNELTLLSKIIEQISNENRPSASFNLSGSGKGDSGVNVVGQLFANIFGAQKVNNAKDAENANIVDD